MNQNNLVGGATPEAYKSFNQLIEADLVEPAIHLSGRLYKRKQFISLRPSPILPYFCHAHLILITRQILAAFPFMLAIAQQIDF